MIDELAEAVLSWPDFAARAISVPFVEHGRSYDGWDCWGIVCVGYRDVLGIKVPDYGEYYETTNAFRALRAAFNARRDAEWQSCNRRLGAVAVILRKNLPIHAGLVIGKRDILHCEQTVGTVIDRDRDLRIESYWEPAWISS